MYHRLGSAKHRPDTVANLSAKISDANITATPSASVIIPLTGGDGKVDKGFVPDFVGATSVAAGSSGGVPAPSAGDQNKVLVGGGTWETPNPLGDSVLAAAAGTQVVTGVLAEFRIPDHWDGKEIADITVGFYTAPTGGSGDATFQVTRRRGVSEADILDTVATITYGAYSSSTGADINASNGTLALGDWLILKCVTQGASGPPEGCAFSFVFTGVPSLASGVYGGITGVMWENTSGTVLTLTPDGVDGYARIPVTSGTTGNRSVEVITANLTLDTTASGAGGIASIYTIQASNFYDVYLISGSSGQALIGVETTKKPVTDWALPSGYTNYSDPIFGFYTSGTGTIVGFLAVKGGRDVGFSGAFIASGITVTSNISYGVYAPDWCEVKLLIEAYNTAAQTLVRLFSDTAQVDMVFFHYVGSGTSNYPYVVDRIVYCQPSTTIRMVAGATLTGGGFFARVFGIRLPYVLGR